MQISYSKQREPKKRPYINFRLRKLINEFLTSHSNDIYSLHENERAQYIADNVEKIVSEHFWIKRKDVNDSIKKAA